jgi:CRP-like cAMP-binding protein
MSSSTRWRCCARRERRFRNVSASPLLTNIERLMVLRTFAGFATLTPSEIGVMAAQTRKRFFPAGTIISEEGAPPRSIHFIVDGEIELSRHGHKLRSYDARSAVGGLNALARDLDTPRMLASQDTVTLEISTDDMEDVFEDNFGIVIGVMRAITRGILEMRAELGKDAGYHDDGENAKCPARPLDLVERIFFLRKTIAFARTRIEALAQLARNAEEIRLDAGTVLWREGDQPDQIIFPICGRVKATTEVGQEFYFRPGGTFGGLDSMAQRERWFTAEVDEYLIGLRFDREIFLDVLEDHYEMARDFMGLLAANLLGLLEQAAGHDHEHERRQAAAAPPPAVTSAPGYGA